jgi:hypothetical protein
MVSLPAVSQATALQRLRHPTTAVKLRIPGDIAEVFHLAQMQIFKEI